MACRHETEPVIKTQSCQGNIIVDFRSFMSNLPHGKGALHDRLWPCCEVNITQVLRLFCDKLVTNVNVTL